MDSPPALKEKKERKEKKHHHHKHDSASSSSKKRKHDSRTPGDAERSKKKKKKLDSDEHAQHASFLESEAATFSPKPKKAKGLSSGGSITTTAAGATATPSASKPTAKAATRHTSSPYHLITSTLYLPLSPISISPSHALSSLLSEHLSPLLLTYYPPFRGVVLAYANASMSSTPPASPAATAAPPTAATPLTLARTAGEYGVMFVYVTATFLVFRPETGQVLDGWVNVQSEGFLGAIVNNLFSVGIDRRRLPRDWRWLAPGEEPAPSRASSVAGTEAESEYEREGEGDKDASTGPGVVGLVGGGNAVASLESAEDDTTGYFVTAGGRRVGGTIRFRVRDVDVIPGAERDRGFITIEGSMLAEEEEARVVEGERRKAGGKGTAAVAAAAALRAGREGAAAESIAVDEESEADLPQDDAMDVDEPVHEEVAEVRVKKERKREKADKKEKKEKRDKHREKKSKKSAQ